MRRRRNAVQRARPVEYVRHELKTDAGPFMAVLTGVKNFETRDDRRIIPGTCFSVEPGIYLPEFGVRSEVDVYVEERDARVTGEVQQAIVPILAASE